MANATGAPEAQPDIPDGLAIDDVRFLEELATLPASLAGQESDTPLDLTRYACAYCGVGDSGAIQARRAPIAPNPQAAQGAVKIQSLGGILTLPVTLLGDRLGIRRDTPLDGGKVVAATLVVGTETRPVLLREMGTSQTPDGQTVRVYSLAASAGSLTESVIGEGSPTSGCVKLRLSMGQQRTTFPIHIAPSVLDAPGGPRRKISYVEGIERLADLILKHRGPGKQVLVYGCGQIDYFSVFAMQEVFRLLGIRNMTGNAEHCLNAGAVHNEILTGQEGPFLTIRQALEGEDRFYLLNGWNGFITHPPAFHQLLKRKQLDAYMVEVAVTESAKALVSRLGPERLLLIRSGTDPHLALSVAHELLENHPEAADSGFLDRHADRESHDRYCQLAKKPEFEPEAVATRIAAEPRFKEHLLAGIRDIARKLATPGTVPINIPSVGLSQTTGVVAHCLWGSALAHVGKYGLRRDGSPAGGTLRIPGQINAQSEVQGLSRNFFMGRIRMTPEGAVDAARRMGLPDDAYAGVAQAKPTAALDYSEPPAAGEENLVISFGTQFESNMMNRGRWVRKLEDTGSTLVVVDPIPDPYSLRQAALILPSPPHVAVPKLYQNGEWRLTLSVPRRRAAKETRSDATILYDVIATISRRLREDPAVAAAHPDLARHASYMRSRFESVEAGGQLPRLDGEVSRPILWQRVQEYMRGGEDRIGPLYCRPVHASGERVTWEELLAGPVVYGGVGTVRYQLDPDDSTKPTFADIFGRPGRFRFFCPTEADLATASGCILNSGRSTLTDDRVRVRFATATFNSGKATPAVDMPDVNPVHISTELAERLGIRSGDKVRLTNRETSASIVLPALVSNRVFGESIYVSFHKSKAEIEQGLYLNTVTSHTGRCPYTSQSSFKRTLIQITPERDGDQTC